MEKIDKISSFLFIRHEVFDNPNLNGADIMVYAVLMRFMNYKSRECYPSISTIKKYARLRREAVIGSIKKLEQEGLIHCNRSSGKTTRYTLLEPPRDTSIDFATGTVWGTGTSRFGVLER